MEIRCPHKKFAELEEGRIEVKCSSKFCGAGPGVIVLHRFDAITGKMLDTKRFRDPGPEMIEEVQNDHADSATVRSA